MEPAAPGMRSAAHPASTPGAGRAAGSTACRWPTCSPCWCLQFRCAGPDLVALSAFQADDHVATMVAGVAEVLAGGSPPGHDLGAAPAP
jgi:hypothetical protein